MSFWSKLRRALARDTPVYTPLSSDIEAPGYIVTFLEERIAEIEDADPEGAARCRQVIDACCDHLYGKPYYVPGNDMRSLKRLAKNWADHPDFQPEWETP